MKAHPVKALLTFWMRDLAPLLTEQTKSRHQPRTRRWAETILVSTREELPFISIYAALFENVLLRVFILSDTHAIKPLLCIAFTQGEHECVTLSVSLSLKI